MGNQKPTQSYFISLYNDKYREQFNEELFKRDENAIIEELKNVILSCERNQYFILKVHKFEVIDDYEEIMNMLYNYEESKRKGKNKKKINQYEYVNIKDTDMKILKVTLYLRIGEKSQYITQLICVPRIVDKYYFKISGNYYSAMYQIVDASTYNNATSNSNKDSITFKTTFQPIRIYRNTYELKAIKNGECIEDKKCCYYTARAFNKSFGAFKYILAKYGLYGTFKFMNMNLNIFEFSDKEFEYNEEYYIFKKYNVYSRIPKYMYDNNVVVQSLLFTILNSITKHTHLNEIFTNNFWIENLGGEFSKVTAEKGLSILNSLEGVYDISTKNNIHLPDDQKEDIYCILRWMIVEFNNLRIKDNLDITTKKVRYEDYIASLYAIKFAGVIYKLSDLGKRINMETAIKYLDIKPMFLIDAISKCKLVNYRNLVNDQDGLTALKFTYKGISGIGEKSNNTVPIIYRHVHPSNAYKIDMDSSSKSDPGMGGILCPFVELYDKSFSSFEEPNFWEQQFGEMMTTYKKMIGLKEVLRSRKILLNEDTSKEELAIDESILTVKKLMQPIRKVEETTEFNEIMYQLDVGGNFYYAK